MFLDVQTGGDATLAGEILMLFQEHATPLLAALQATTGQARSEIAHRLKGSALAIGAQMLAAASAAVESDPCDDGLLGPVERHCAAVLDEIGRRSRSAVDASHV